MIDSLYTDLRHACRQICRTPGFSAAVVLTIAITVGATATLFSLYNALVLRSLPVTDPSRIVVVQPIDDKGQNRPLYHQTYLELAKLPVFDHLAL
jgi:macrolide transport system ATP-binding/permease protein